MGKEFVNGFSSWMETHHEVVAEIAFIDTLELEEGLIHEIRTTHGTGGIYELAESLTDEFEQKYKGTAWGEELEFFETLQTFLNQKNL